MEYTNNIAILTSLNQQACSPSIVWSFFVTSIHFARKQLHGASEIYQADNSVLGRLKYLYKIDQLTGFPSDSSCSSRLIRASMLVMASARFPDSCAANENDERIPEDTYRL